ncbi:cell wall hydrolase [Clostridiaceae bacterium]|nr:cell wall hydrolase [Clostridiaceae bacterium]
MMIFDGPEGKGRTTMTVYAKTSQNLSKSEELEVYRESKDSKEEFLQAGETMFRPILAKNQAKEQGQEGMENRKEAREKGRGAEEKTEESERAEAGKTKTAGENAKVSEMSETSKPSEKTDPGVNSSSQEIQEQTKAEPVLAVDGCSKKDYEVLKRIVEAESGGCDIKGRILVANVVINRVKNSKFPNSITDVVYQKSQFSPVSNGTLDSCTVTPETVEAVNRALTGEDYSQGALYFMNRSHSRSGSVSWFDKSLTYLFKHGRHEFFR